MIFELVLIKKMRFQKQEMMIGKTYGLGMRQRKKDFHCIEPLMIVTWKRSGKEVILLAAKDWGTKVFWFCFVLFCVFSYVKMLPYLEHFFYVVELSEKKVVNMIHFASLL